jgi:hypothetical protein
LTGAGKVLLLTCTPSATSMVSAIAGQSGSDIAMEMVRTINAAMRRFMEPPRSGIKTLVAQMSGIVMVKSV